jgi:hypothetical protein
MLLVMLLTVGGLLYLGGHTLSGGHPPISPGFFMSGGIILFVILVGVDSV